MRCLSPLAGYSIQVFEGNEQVVMDARGYAQTIVLGKPVIADFDRGGLLDYEIDAALSNFNFSGIPEGVNPLTRISVFDTEAYVQRLPLDKRDEMLVQIDKRMRELAAQFPTEFIVVEPPAAPRPWPSYDEDTVEDVLKFRERLRIDPTLIRKYEEEHGKRAEILREMWLIEDPATAERLFPAAGEAESFMPSSVEDGQRAAEVIAGDEVGGEITVQA